MSKCETCENEAGIYSLCPDCYERVEGQSIPSMSAKTKQELEDTIDALEIAHSRIDSLLEQNKALVIEIKLVNAENQSFSDENRARWKAEKSLAKLLHDVAHVLAMDTIIDRTHRERNEIERRLVKMIMQSFDADVAQDMDDIPF